ncbi:hypothetical protein DSO57_1037205 [Entomophthora muscae]|uniref:Uncharacterized protein n=1 Tax=Entomophthora muscae TaxID=34485 RepID=A0ACC2TXQ9_9FUNG|nr:hypothetical protein DSO57_1037205 [Entomophthora muscae]
MVPAARPWALVGQSASYLLKLSPLLWWALPFSQQSKLASKASRPPPGMWYPDTYSKDDAKKVQSPKKESFYDTSDTGGPILREPANV